MNNPTPDLDRAIREAVEAERERCARIAVQAVAVCSCDIPNRIATAIRKDQS